MKISNWPLYEIWFKQIINVFIIAPVLAGIAFSLGLVYFSNKPDDGLLVTGLLLSFIFYLNGYIMSGCLLHNDDKTLYLLTPLTPLKKLRQSIRLFIILCMGAYLLLPIVVFFGMRLGPIHKLLPNPLAPLNFTLACLLMAVYPLLLDTRIHPAPWQFIFFARRLLANAFRLLLAFPLKFINGWLALFWLIAMGALAWLFHTQLWDALLQAQRLLLEQGPAGKLALYLFSPFTGLLYIHSGREATALPMYIAIFQMVMIAVSSERFLAQVRSDPCCWDKEWAEWLHELPENNIATAETDTESETETRPKTLADGLCLHGLKIRCDLNYQADRGMQIETEENGPATETLMPLPYDETHSPLGQIVRHEKFWDWTGDLSPKGFRIMSVLIVAVILLRLCARWFTHLNNLSPIIPCIGIMLLAAIEYSYQCSRCNRLFQWSHIAWIRYGEIFKRLPRLLTTDRSTSNIMLRLLCLSLFTPSLITLPLLLLMLTLVAVFAIQHSCIMNACEAKRGWRNVPVTGSDLITIIVLTTMSISTLDLLNTNTTPMIWMICVTAILAMLVLIYSLALLIAGVRWKNQIMSDPKAFAHQHPFAEDNNP